MAHPSPTSPGFTGEKVALVGSPGLSVHVDLLLAGGAFLCEGVSVLHHCEIHKGKASGAVCGAQSMPVLTAE